jgi:hypothetical protein
MLRSSGSPGHIPSLIWDGVASVGRMIHSGATDPQC